MEEDKDSDVIQLYESFDDMGLCVPLLRGIYAYGFEEPSAIQQKAIVPFAKGENVIAQAQSGTGKTGTFAIGLLNRIDVNVNRCQALVLVPTRELALQISKVIESIGSVMKVKCHTCIGGTKRYLDVETLRHGVHVVVGTAGRVYDMLEDGCLNRDDIEVFVLDEADEMLNIDGFQDDVYDIMNMIPQSAQIGLFSATMPHEVIMLSEKFMKDAVKIIVKSEELTLEGIGQFYVSLRREDKFDTICDLYEKISITSCVIFCNLRKTVEILADEMVQSGFPVTAMHGSMAQEDRRNIMSDFRSGKCRVLITTDIMARGIDVQHVSIVINYDLPKSMENYIHRIGRSGRFGRKGLAINFVTERDVQKIRDLEKFYNTCITELPMDINKYI